MSSSDRVALVATMRSEEPGRVGRMLAALEAQDCEMAMDFIVAVPPSEVDVTEAIFNSWSRGQVTVVLNPTGERSAGLNLALDHAHSRYAIRVDARSRPPADYVRRCVSRLSLDATVGVVGGIQLTRVSEDAPLLAQGIGRALRNRWLLGNARYRNQGAAGAADTVYLGAFRTDQLGELRYDEHLSANEDYDLCERYRNRGFTVWLESGLAVNYEPRQELRGLGRQYFDFGRSKVRYWRRSGRRPEGRQLVALVGGAVVVSAVAIGMRRPPVLAAVGAMAVLTYFVTDELADPDPASASVRLAALPAHLVIEAGWLAGILRGLLEGTPARHQLR